MSTATVTSDAQPVELECPVSESDPQSTSKLEVIEVSMPGEISDLSNV